MKAGTLEKLLSEEKTDQPYIMVLGQGTVPSAAWEVLLIGEHLVAMLEEGGSACIDGLAS